MQPFSAAVQAKLARRDADRALHRAVDELDTARERLIDLQKRRERAQQTLRRCDSEIRKAEAKYHKAVVAEESARWKRWGGS